jgi:hypothetical protein
MMMSMSTHVKRIVPPDEQWKKMKAIYDSCEAAGIEAPDEVSDYFREVVKSMLENVEKLIRKQGSTINRYPSNYSMKLMRGRGYQG